MLSSVCSEVIYSQHYNYTEDVVFPGNIHLVADVKELTETGVCLVDGTSYSVDSILYCTGFHYSFPFLSTDCGISVDDNYVSPLYKQLININFPTMAFIGLNYHLCIQLVMDLQARYCTKFWSTNRAFPSKEEMLAESRKDLETRLAMGWKKRHAHRLWDLHDEYNKSLADMAEIPGIAPVYLKIYFDAMGELRKKYGTYRAAKYRIIDEDSYEKVEAEEVK